MRKKSFIAAASLLVALAVPAWHVTDSRRMFIGLIGFDETANTQVVLTPGFERNAVPAVTCRFVGGNGHLFRVIGVLT